MEKPKDHPQEEDRLRDLRAYDILDTLPEDEYDNLTKIASFICDTDISLVSLIDENRQWFKSRTGLDAIETPREYAFCAHAINDEAKLFEIEDATSDPRFRGNPLVTGDPHIRFYAGVKLNSRNGLPLGTLCVIDKKPKRLAERQRQALMALSRQVENLLELRLSKKELKQSNEQLSSKNEELEKFAYVAAHDLKSPLAGIISLSDILNMEYGDEIDDEGSEMLGLIGASARKLSGLIEGLLDYTRSDAILQKSRSVISLDKLPDDLKAYFPAEQDNLEITLESELEDINVNRSAIEQILMNLISNSVKYNDKEKTRIRIEIKEADGLYKFSVEDNGPGIPEKDRDRLFKIFETGGVKDRYGKHGHGIGLSTVKKLVEKMDGEIRIDTEYNMGSRFLFSISK